MPLRIKTKNSEVSEFAERFGGQGRDRTGDTRIFSPLLYQLSYLATCASVKALDGRGAGIRTLDPVIKSHLLYQLSYAPISPWLPERFVGARNGTRTRDNHLGKVALYQLSYPRIFASLAKTRHSKSQIPFGAQGSNIKKKLG